MSLELFHLQKEMLDTEITKFKDFLTNNLQEHDIPPADISLLHQYLENVKSKLSQDLGKSVEDAVKGLIVKDWKVIFTADNYIDDGKTLDEQKYILTEIIRELNTQGKLTHTYLPAKIADSVNVNFLESEYKLKILIEELTAELNLCNPEIHWTDALSERIRVMFYSAFLVSDMDGIENFIKKLIRNTDYLSFLDQKDIEKYLQDNVFDLSIINPIELILKKEDYGKIIEDMKIVPERPITIKDIVRTIILLCIGVAPSDDYMDIDEDIQNNKITGITRAMSQNISIRSILSTTIVYISKNISDITLNKHIELWYTQLMTLMYHDISTCLDFCKNASPYLFQLLFQRK